MKKISIQIPENESLTVEKLFFKYNSLMNVLAFLSKENCDEKFLDKKIDEAVELNIQLEHNKTLYGEKYKPEGYNCLNYTYDFDNYQIIYEVE